MFIKRYNSKAPEKIGGFVFTFKSFEVDFLKNITQSIYSSLSVVESSVSTSFNSSS